MPFDAIAAVGCAVVTGVGAVTTAAKAPQGFAAWPYRRGRRRPERDSGSRARRARASSPVDRGPRRWLLRGTFGATETMRQPTATGRRRSSIDRVAAAPTTYSIRSAPPTPLPRRSRATRKGGTACSPASRASTRAAHPHVPARDAGKAPHRTVCTARSTDASTSPASCSCIRRDKLKLRELVARTYTLDQINDALDALAASTGARGVILL